MRDLVSGAGVAGLSTAINPTAIGHDMTIVERATQLRVNESPIDIRGEAIGIVAQMGVPDQIRAHRVDMSQRIRFVGSHGEVPTSAKWHWSPRPPTRGPATMAGRGGR